MDAPRRRWDPAAFEGSPAQAAVDRVYESIEGVSGTWPELLPAAAQPRADQARDLVERLAGRARASRPEPQIEKIGAYYHRMEHGTLPADRRLRPGDRRARDDRRQHRRGDQGRRCPPGRGDRRRRRLRPHRLPGRGVPRAARPRTSASPMDAAPAEVPPSGTRSTPSSSTAESSARPPTRPVPSRRWRG